MLRKDIEDLDNNGSKGDWCLIEGQCFVLRFGESYEDVVAVFVSDKKEDLSQGIWLWNGNLNKPTITSHIAVPGELSSNIWEGFIVDGVMQTV